MKEQLHVFCLVINAVLIKANQQRQGESQRNIIQSPQLNVHTSSSMTRKSSVSERQQLLKV